MREVKLPLSLGEQAREADLIIIVDYERTSSGKYRCQYRLKSALRNVNLNYKKFQSPELAENPRSYFQEIFSFLNRAAGGSSPNGSYVYEKLTKIGADLYNKFFCDDFKEFYWRVIDKNIKSIQIVSDEAWIPWELIRPGHKNPRKSKFICERFNITRWIAGPYSPDWICINPLGIVVMKSELRSAATEAEEIKQVFSEKSMSVNEVRPSFENVNNQLASGGLSSLHFIGHGVFNSQNPDYSSVRLENGELNPVDINDTGLVFGQDCSLVFLNACETGIGGEALTGIGGWAEAFIKRAETGSFIGSVWRSRDTSASKFSVFFYKKLLEGKTIGEAVRLARKQIMTKQDPTWLAYSVYANPMARLLCQYCHNGMRFEENVS